MQSKRIKKMNEASRMTSIARKINFEFWLRQFANFIAIDLILLITICVSFFLWREGLVPDSAIGILSGVTMKTGSIL